MDYTNTFNERVKQYNYAINTYPDVLKNEFETAIELCNIKNTDSVLNILAGGSPLHKYFITMPFLYREYEINTAFSELDNISLCKLNNIPEESNTINTIIILAALHHINHNEQQDLFKECFRILDNTSGKLIIGDVIDNSKESRWLNEFVNKYNSSGHKGVFFSSSDKSNMEQNGFLTKVQVKTYPWIFNDENALIDFCKNLFGLDLATNVEIINGIHMYLNPEMVGTQIHIQWTLIYFISIKHPMLLQHP